MKKYNESQVFTMLCVWEHVEKRSERYEAFFEDFGTATMRSAAIVAGAFIEEVHEILRAQHYECNEAFDFEIVPTICDMIDWEPIVQNAAYSVELNLDAAQIAGRVLTEHPDLYYYEDPKPIWMQQARNWAGRYWCYPDLVDDNPETFEQAFTRGDDPRTFVRELGEKLDLMPRMF